MGFNFTIGAATDVGQVRTLNEDRFTVDLDLGLFVVADGVGGQNAGEVASNMAIEIISSHVNGAQNCEPEQHPEQHKGEFSQQTNQILNGIRMANIAIYEKGLHNSQQRGMATTVSSVRIHGNIMTLAHVGDSRIYRVRGGCLERLTIDHSLLEEQLKHGISFEEANSSIYKNALLRALGAEETIQIDADEDVLLDRDWLLLCTDGLSNMVDEEEIARVVCSSENDPQGACKKLVELANQNGGKDNITVVLVYCQKTKQRFGQLPYLMGFIPRELVNIVTKFTNLLVRNKRKSASSLSEINSPGMNQENVKDGNFTVKI